MLYVTYVLGNDRTERENNLRVQEAANLVDRKLLSARGIATNINASTTIKKLYKEILSGRQTLDSYTLYSILSELKMIHASAGNIEIEEVVILVDNYSRAYTSTGVVSLDEPFSKIYLTSPRIAADTISNVMAISGRGKLTFQKNGLLYIDNYTYSTGASKGCVVVMLNLESLYADLSGVLHGGAGMRLVLGDETVLSNGRTEGRMYSAPLRVMPNARVETYFVPPFIPPDTARVLILLLMLGAVVTSCFLGIAYYFSRKYYRPIGRIGELVNELSLPEGEDEMTNILHGITSLIGERNGYREKMVTIAPYARQGVLHGVLSGHFPNDSVQVLLSKEFVDLQKPYFIISAVNILYPGLKLSAAEFNRAVQKLCDNITSLFSTEERRVYTEGGARCSSTSPTGRRRPTPRTFSRRTAS